MKQIIRLTESDLHRVINESVKRILVNEGFFDKLFGKKKEPPRPVRKNPMDDIIKAKTNPDGTIANSNDPLDERICVNGTMNGMGDTTYFGKKGSLPWYYQTYPNINGRQGLNHEIKQKNGGRFSQIQYFDPEWVGSRGGGMTVTFWKVLTQQELQKVEQIMKTPGIYDNGIVPFVQKIDSVLMK